MSKFTDRLRAIQGTLESDASSIAYEFATSREERQAIEGAAEENGLVVKIAADLLDEMEAALRPVNTEAVMMGYHDDMAMRVRIVLAKLDALQ